jgi:pSer/pThr/pTyr-binding forkhead associated (FHA) protein
VSDQLLTFLKYIFLAILYLFFLRVLRAVWMELREPKPAPAPAAPPPSPTAGTPSPTGRRSRRRGRTPGGERLVVVDPVERRGLSFTLGDELTVGRAGGCGVPLSEDSFVSQLHARVFRRDGELYVEDLGSTNGTYLNKKKIAAAVAMRKGDQLQIGKTTMEVQR